MLITVAIPCYNLEDRIAKCLESVISQDYHDIEVLVIDDHSTDNSAEVVNRFIGQHPERDIRFIINETNIGINRVRNIAIDEALGEYIFFVDGDDTIELGTLSMFYRRMEETHVDVVCGSFRTIDTYGRTILVEKHFAEDTIRGDFAYAIYIEKYIRGYFHVPVWNNLYNLDFIKANKIYCATHYRNYEDLDFTFKVALNAKSVSFINEITYNYCKCPTSISYNKVDTEWFENLRTIIEYIFDTFNNFPFFRGGGEVPYGIRFLLNYICLTNGLLKMGLESNVSQIVKIQYINWLKDMHSHNSIYLSNIVGKYNKLSYLILVSPIPYPLFRFYFRHIKTISKIVNTFSK